MKKESLVRTISTKCHLSSKRKQPYVSFMFVIFFFFNHLNAQNNQVTPNLQLERVRNWYLNWLGKSLLQNLKLGEEKEKKKKKIQKKSHTRKIEIMTKKGMKIPAQEVRARNHLSFTFLVGSVQAAKGLDDVCLSRWGNTLLSLPFKC